MIKSRRLRLLLTYNDICKRSTERTMSSTKCILHHPKISPPPLPINEEKCSKLESNCFLSMTRNPGKILKQFFTNFQKCFPENSINLHFTKITNQSQVKKIHSHSKYDGEITGYNSNLAVLEVDQTFVFNDYILPICIDWIQRRKASPTGDFFQVSAWGLKQDRLGDNLQEASLAVIDTRPCRSTYKNLGLHRYINYDKFCVVTPQGRASQDEGSPFVQESRGRYYLKGVMGTLLNQKFSVATNITKHLGWLQDVMYQIDNEKRCYLPVQLAGGSYRLENCNTGANCNRYAGDTISSDESVLLTCGRGTIASVKGPRYACLKGKWFYEEPKCQKCGKPNPAGLGSPTITNGQNVTYGKYPWHVALLIRESREKEWEQSCGGTILRTNLVLTAAHCLFSRSTEELLSPDKFLVAAGKGRREWTILESNQQSSRVCTNPLLCNSITTFILYRSRISRKICHSFNTSNAFLRREIGWVEGGEVVYFQLSVLFGIYNHLNDVAGQDFRIFDVKTVAERFAAEEPPLLRRFQAFLKLHRYVGSIEYCLSMLEIGGFRRHSGRPEGVPNLFAPFEGGRRVPKFVALAPQLAFCQRNVRTPSDRLRTERMILPCASCWTVKNCLTKMRKTEVQESEEGILCNIK
ncbi:unnamed protein product [Nesidiocoris tenuis]|uniref:Peptidase S1 domain-containing protein n=1 Tax=Nesidiocoris tenuis TaxID=355587 RepID=A0A6H5G550_9HEMI|nr:unnamed protein product [Nesidiocoris tenuis]